MYIVVLSLVAIRLTKGFSRHTDNVSCSHNTSNRAEHGTIRFGTAQLKLAYEQCITIPYCTVLGTVITNKPHGMDGTIQCAFEHVNGITMLSIHNRKVTPFSFMRYCASIKWLGIKIQAMTTSLHTDLGFVQNSLTVGTSVPA